MEGSEQITESQTDTTTPVSDDDMSDEDFFAKEIKEGFPSLREKDGKTDDAPKVETTEPAKVETPELQPIKPPSSYPPDLREAFGALPREAQEKLTEWQTKRDTDIQGLLSEANQTKERFAKTAELEEVMKPCLSGWKMEGVAPAAVMSQMFEVQEFLNRDPIGGLNWLASTYGLDLAEVAQAAQQNFNDPAFAVRQEVEELRFQLEEERRVRQESEVNQFQSSLVQEIAGFAQETDPAGNAVYPFFADVHEEMVPIVQMLRRQYPQESNKRILQEAYDRSVRANPETWKHVIQQEETKRQAQIKAKSEQAKKAGFSVARPGSTNVNENLDELDDDAFYQNWFAQRRK